MLEEPTPLPARGEGICQQDPVNTCLRGPPSPAPSKLFPGPPLHTQGSLQDAAGAVQRQCLASPLHADLPVAALADVQIVEVPGVVGWVTASKDYFPPRFQRSVPRVQNTVE